MEPTILNAANQPMQLTRGQYDQIQDFIESMNAEREALKGNSPEQIIEFYLDYMQSRDPQLADAYPHNPQGKTIKDCYRYILKKARQTANGSSATMQHHNVVFGWAKDYFVDASIPKEESQTTTKAYVPKPAPPKNSAKEYADKHTQALQWQAKHEEKIARWEKEQLKKIREYDMDLFNNPDDNPYRKEKCPFLSEKNPYKNYLAEPNHENNPVQTEDNQE